MHPEGVPLLCVADEGVRPLQGREMDGLTGVPALHAGLMNPTPSGSKTDKMGHHRRAWQARKLAEPERRTSAAER
jgi:hypothetical protein